METPSCGCKEGFYDNNIDLDCQECPFMCKKCELTSENKVNCLQCYGELKYNEKKQLCECPPLSYNMDPKSSTCHQCPSNVNCLGGKELEILPGYWRSSLDSDKIEKCHNK